MPAYNCGKYISHSIKSILNQTYINFELIIIDDGSNDNTAEIVRNINDGRIIYEKTDHKGTSAALNRGVYLAKGDWIARIDADDLNTPDRLEKQIKFFSVNPQYNVISSWSVYFSNEGNVCYLWKSPVNHEEIYESLNLLNPLNQSGLLIKKNLLLENKFDESFIYFEDYELMYRIRNKAKFYNIPDLLVYTRIRDDSKSVIGNTNKIYNLLFPSSIERLLKSETSKELRYWNGICGDLCLYYGNLNDATKYYRKSFKLENYFKIFMILILGEKIRILFKKNIKLRFKNIFMNKTKFRKFVVNNIY
jgi:glycosyltransferase involved in cell wall biosynthesis